jgi:putative PEP-CTERM system histidine kinase
VSTPPLTAATTLAGGCILPPPGMAAAGALSHSAACLAFLALGALLLTRWRGRQHARAAGLAALLTAGWSAALVTADLTLAFHACGTAQRVAVLVAQILEVIRSGGWIVFLLALLQAPGKRRRRYLLAVAAVGALQLGLVMTAAGFPTMPGATWAATGYPAMAWTVISRLLLAVLGMLMIEQWYRATQAQERWGIKFACLGIGALFAYDFYLYSNALLLGRISAEAWAARGIVNALSAPLLAVSAMRNPNQAQRLSVSRQLLLHSVALLGSAIYLLAMASCAWYIRYAGGAWGPLMQAACLAAAVLLLLALLFSGSLRARLKVLISKHFYTGMYDYRREWLRFTRALAEDGPDLHQRTIEAMAALVESPAGALWIRREHGTCEPVASWNLPPQAALEPADSAFCQFLETRQWVVDIRACGEPGLRHGFVPIPPWLAEQAIGSASATPPLWLVVPLMLHGRLFGFVALAQPRTRMTLNWEVTDLLRIAGSQAAGYLAHRESAESLAVARQFESFNRMSTFIVHDLKNLVSQLSLLLANAEKHKANPEFQEDMLATLAHSVQKMGGLLLKLADAGGSVASSPVELDKLLAQAVASRAAAEPAPRLQLEASGLTVLADRARLERVLGHIIQNAIEATPRHGHVVVRLLRSEDSAVVEMNDTGKGMSQQFMRERLFRPFETTKVAGMGIGVFESREYIRQVGGQLEVSSEPAVGTTFRVILPLHMDPVGA